ncbi:MAG: hypothetical protein ACRD20_12545 [Terriglobales bacterium]
MNIELQSMAIEMPSVAGHPNRQRFRGVLTLVDVVSDKAPSGARGHRVVLARAAADAALASLLGMGLDYAPSLDRHDTQRKIGVITRADIVGKQLELDGHLFAKDFPDIVREIERGSGMRRRHPAGEGFARPSLHALGHNHHAETLLGMSYEITDARVADVRSSVWTLTHVTFTGAAVLRRDKAAYRDTWIELV